MTKHWKSHHWGAAMLLVAGVFAFSFYWGQVVQASQPAPSPYQVGTRVQTNTGLNVRDKANTSAGAVQCIQQAGSTGTITDGPKKSQGYTWVQVDWDTYCDGWSAIDGPLTIL